jgi:Clr5 domain
MDLDISGRDHDETPPQRSQKGSVLSRNDQKWESLKQDIHKVYMSENTTLSQTMIRIEEGFGFKASWVFPRVFSRRTQSLMHVF